MTKDHKYLARCAWSGSTGVGYDDYDRGHSGEAPPATESLELSTDAAFLGQDDHLNPEQLLVMAAASCQLLSFLAAAARSRVDVISYEDDAEGFMPLDRKPIAFTKIVLRPKIQLAPGPTEERVQRLVEVAHAGCYVANSLSCPVEVAPSITFR